MDAKQLNRAKRQAAKIHGGKPSEYTVVENQIVLVLQTEDGRKLSALTTKTTRDVWLSREVAGHPVNYHVRID